VAITDELYYPPLGEWVENHMYPTIDGGLVIFQRYVTERKRAEEKLRRSEAYLADGQKMSHTGSWAWNVSTRELFWSLEHYRICGVDPESFKLTIEAALQLIHPDDRPGTDQNFDIAIHEKRDFERDLRVLRPDGTIRYVHSLGRPVFSESGDLIEYVGTIMDVTERKKTQEALYAAQTELAHLNRVSTMGELTSSIAHELSQPLAAIATNGGACLRWLDREIPELDEARRSVEEMVANAMRAGDVVEHIRTLVRKTDAQRELLNVNGIIREVLALSAYELTKNHVEVRMDFQSDLPPVMGDRIQLQQVLLNLIGNSTQAMTALDWPVRELTISSQQSEPGKVKVAVQDTGTGLGPNDPERLFDPFFSSKEGGMGLGLTISRRIVEAHGGRLWARANEGSGATFQFSLSIS
jgi:PAS domain S-box-containing protein